MTNARSDHPSTSSTLDAVMTKDVQTVAADTELRVAAEDMRARGVGFLPVVEASKPIGVVTDRDLALRGAGRGLDPSTATVAEIMTPIVAWVTEGQGLEHVTQVMRDRRVRRVVVLDDAGELSGVVSLSDLARADRVSAETLTEVMAALSR